MGLHTMCFAAAVLGRAEVAPAKHWYDDPRWFQAAFAFGAFVVASVALFIAMRSKGTADRAARVAAWNTAHSRLGTLYDMAINDAEIRAVAMEADDPDVSQSDRSRRPESRTPKQLQWVANMMLALEQATIASTAMDAETRESWDLYARNRVRKPTLRAAFLEAEAGGGRCDERVWRTHHRAVQLALQALNVLSSAERLDKDKGRYRAALKDLHGRLGFRPIETTDHFESDHGGKPLRAFRMTTLPRHRPHREEIEELYAHHSQDDQGRLMMLPLPDNLDDLINSGHVFIVQLDRVTIGMFRVYECFGQASFGVLINSDHRKGGVATKLVAWAARYAKDLGYTFAYADIYNTNAHALDLMRSAGLMEFTWFGAPLDDVLERVESH